MASNLLLPIRLHAMPAPIAATPAAPIPIAAIRLLRSVSEPAPAVAAATGGADATGTDGDALATRGAAAATCGGSGTSTNETRAYSPAATFTVLTAGT